jgi:hypothetical protein
MKLECELTETTWWKTCHAVAGLESWGKANTSNCSKEERWNCQSNAAGNWSYSWMYGPQTKGFVSEKEPLFFFPACQDRKQYLSLLIFRVSYRNFLNHGWYVHIWLDANLKIHHAHYQSPYELHQTQLWIWCTSTDTKRGYCTLQLALCTRKFNTSAL